MVALAIACGLLSVARCQERLGSPGQPAPAQGTPPWGLETSSLIYPEPLPAAEFAPTLPNFEGAAAYPGQLGMPSVVPPWSPLSYSFGGAARGYYINDQRIEFTGQEATFAVEGVLDAEIHQEINGWDCRVAGELFINQPYDRNVLVDSPERQSFASNFDIDILQISQLFLGARRGDFEVLLGRFVTPFGRFYYPIYRNNFDDSPFIRSDAILYRETGALLQWDPEGWVFTAALTNGGREQDTNSSKALVSRVGIDREAFALGASIKVQDGIGSEGQKTYNEHVGMDAMVQRGQWQLSGEVIYDHYGIRRPGYPLQDIFWGRSLYFRDLNRGYHQPITGVGYYVNLGYYGPHWSATLNYGGYSPMELGNPNHDIDIQRGFVKLSRFWSPHFETYAVVMLENDRDDNLDTHPREGTYVLIGGQFSL